MSEAFDALGINGPQLLAQIANFLVLLVILRFTLYKPILGMLDDRKARIAEGLGAAEKARGEATAAQERIDEQIQQARRDGQEVVANAQQIAARIQQDARDQSERDRETLAERARQDIQLERDRAVADLRAEFADITVSAAEKVIGESIDANAHQRIIDETLAESSLSEN
jgi:F-type H+-transporting ATPase subunit b